MAEIIDLQPRQTELAFPPRPTRSNRRAHGPSSARLGPAPPPVVSPTRSRRPLAPQTRRLEISPEAYAAAESGGAAQPEARTRQEGLLEAVLVLLATVGFGLAWMAVEQGRGETPASGYAEWSVNSSAESASEREQTWTNAIDVAVHGSSRP